MAALVCLAAAAPAWAQGGAGSTGTITGRVVDDSGGVLPGVTVTVSSPAMMGVRTGVTDGEGVYRFPGVPAGAYAVKFELAGLQTITRENIVITIGFTAQVDVRMAVQALEETVTVMGDSPVVDAASTRVQTAYTQDQLNSLPNARDMWSLLATTPSVTLNRVDVGGATAGTQPTYYSYGYAGQNWPLVEGINTTEGTSAAGFYLDYGSFEEVFIGPVGNTAEMPVPGVLTQFVGKSGGNRFSVGVYFDYENDKLQGTNLTPEQVKPSPTQSNAFRNEKANRLYRYRNLNAGVGGPIVKDRLWFHFAYSNQRNETLQPAGGVILDGTPFPTELENETIKTTYSLSTSQKLIGYLQYGTKKQPYRTDSVVGNPRHLTKDSTLNQSSPSWVYKGEYNRTMGNTGFLEVRAGQFGYDWGMATNTNEPRREDLATLEVTGGGRDWLLNRRRNQFTTAYSFFKDRFLGGNHNLKAGYQWMDETGRTRWNSGYADQVVQLFSNGVAAAVRLYATPSDSQNGLRTNSFFLTDTWAINRLTFNLGMRYDRYRVYLPAQEHPAGRFFPTALTFAAVDSVVTFNNVVPRVGLIFDVTGDSKTLVKANFGRFYFNPGVNLADSVNPNTADQFSQYAWTDRNGDRLYQPGEEGALTQRFGGVANAAVDPDLKNSRTNEFSAWLEREIIPNLGTRVGFVWKKDYDGYQQMNRNRPIGAYNVPVTVADIGPDGVAGTSDDSTISAFNLNPAALALPSSNVTANIDDYQGTYKTIELGANKRWSHRWSMVASFSYTWTEEYARTYYGNAFASAVANSSLFGAFPNNPNDRSHNEYTNWNLKLHGTYEGPWAVRFTPVFKYQSGAPYGRYVNAALNYGTQPILVEPIGTRRQENLSVVDLRVERFFRFARQARVGLFLDVFNMTNANPAVNINWATGPRFQFPTTVLPPRIAKLGVKFDW